MASTARIRNGSIRCLYPSTTTGVGVWDFGATYGWEVNFRVFGPSGNDGHFTFPNKVCKIGGYFRAEIRSWYPNGSLTLHAAGSSTDVQISGYFATLSDTVNIGSVNVDNTGVTGNKWTFNSHVYDWMETANGASRGWTKNAESCYASSAVARGLGTLRTGQSKPFKSMLPVAQSL